MRVLIVEDERKIANALKRGLEQESFAVDVSFDGDDGLAMALDEPYDVIVLDRMLPGTDGLSLCKQVREAGKQVPIIMLTAKDAIGDRVAGLNSGADDYLIKPFAFEELLARIRSLLRRPAQVISPVLACDDLTMNTQTFEVRRSDTQVALTSKEFALLEYLLRNQGKVLTKDTIIGHVWDYDADILPNTVEVYISYLRNKIDRAFPDRPGLVHTMRGFGYKLGV
ncbi:MAG TPA: response regulator transcription factor [Candidatus Saccharimonadales bacterium]|nr:response regulator transcription factor [Candidatus Saccharimonadales bacterium]